MGTGTLKWVEVPLKGNTTICTSTGMRLPRGRLLFVYIFQVPDRATMIRELEERKRHNTRTSVAFGSAQVRMMYRYAPQNENSLKR